ncbi:amino acid permease [Aspergillus costaricaensis CBS 115574]|uniref:Amino acid permease n=1 Tax=Aspergillus costaricaensis CBS 115574 TaxID=1448317 RepID=A0ACD1IUV4_9EURO|nr:amino acid permease [Aspergillus costaricaensis CBS 115574]RAK94419.1 amino acid permease [Aspergillus costaricaensis CBS 115574]
MTADLDRKGTIVSLESIQDGEIGILDLDGGVTPEINGDGMPRQFNWLSTLGISFSITNSWAGYMSNFGQILAYGGPRLVIFGSICAFVVQIIVILGLSELASAFPSDQVEEILSVRGRMYVCLSMVDSDVGCIAPDLSIDKALMIVADLPVSRWLRPPLRTALFLSLTGMALIITISLGMCQEKQPVSFLLQRGYGTSGWNEGTAWMLGIMNTMYSMTGIDAAIHISEELPQPEKRVPQAMTMSVILSLATCLPLSVALMFCMSDMEAVINSELPSLEVMYQATKSKGVTTFLSVWLLVVYAASIPSQWVTCGRVAWALARDINSPSARYFAKVDDKLKFPVRTTVASFGFVAIYSLLYLVSSGAFNTITNSAILFLHITYVVPQGILLMKGRAGALPFRYLKLGCLGYLCNAFVILWIVILGVFVCLPLGLPVEAESMNYTAPVLIGLFGLVILLWYGLGRVAFQGPQIDRDMMQEVNSASFPAMDAHLDLTLPSTCPELQQGSDANWDDASFALYSMIELSSEELDKLITALNRDWKREMTDEAMPLVRTPTVYDFSGKSLRDVVQAHVELDKEFTPRDDGGAEGDIHWYPTAFVVVTTREWEEKGLLLVYADVEEKECPMDKFFFHIDNANILLSSLNFGDESPSSSKFNWEMGHGVNAGMDE